LIKYLMIIEKAQGNFSAYSPDLPGCVATGETLEELESNMQGAVEMHIQGLLEDGQPVPEPRSSADYIEVDDISDIAKQAI
jgi:predicted RNase H-like HicB family nuclease